MIEKRETDEALIPRDRQLQELFAQMPAAVAIVRGPRHVFELANPLYHQIVGKTELVGKPGREAVPEITAQGIWDIFDRIYATGEPFVGNEFPARLDRRGDGQLDPAFFNFVGQPLRDGTGNVDGILLHAVDVTAHVQARQRAEELAALLRTERERLHLAQEAGHIGAFEWFIQEDRIIWTPALEALYGLRPGGFEGRLENWSQRLHADDRAEAVQTLQRAVASGSDFVSEFRVVWPDGQVRHLAAKAQVFADAAGQPERMIGVNLDISDRKHMEASMKLLADASKLLAQSLDYEQTLRNVSHLIVPTLADIFYLDIVGDDQQLERVAWAHRDKNMARLLDEVGHYVPSSEHLNHPINRVLATGKPVLVPRVTARWLKSVAMSPEHLAFMRHMGFVSMLAVPLMAKTRPIGVLACCLTPAAGRRYTHADLATATELANRIGLSIENTRLVADLQQAVSLRDDFLSLASHELRTPITSLKGFAQLLQKRAARRGDDEYARFLAKMDGQITNLSDLVNDLLDLSRIQAGQLVFHRERFSIDEIIREVVENVQATTTTHRITIDGLARETVIGDRDRIGQVLINFLTNAIKYSPHADTVIVHVSRDHDSVVVGVQDRGIGIPAEHQDKVFDRFYQVTDQKNRVLGGLGIGLYISAEIVQRHNGTIWVESVPGQGSTFSFMLPLID